MSTPPSPLDAALARVGDRWSLLVVEALLAGPQRFNDLLAAVPGVATNVLSQRLKRLESEAVVVARPYSERPPRFSYELTATGAELAGALRLLAGWGGAELPRHTACGTPLETRWHCPTCARPVTDPTRDDLHYL
ncbi:MAG: winged helix-turn-helix transcriptional regulator [Acidimicrobiia bacterium]